MQVGTQVGALKPCAFLCCFADIRAVLCPVCLSCVPFTLPPPPQVSGLPAKVSTDELMSLLTGPGGLIVERLDLTAAAAAAGTDAANMQVGREGRGGNSVC